jgi:hypothetical protein
MNQQQPKPKPKKLTTPLRTRTGLKAGLGPIGKIGGT